MKVADLQAQAALAEELAEALRLLLPNQTEKDMKIGSSLQVHSVDRIRELARVLARWDTAQKGGQKA